MFPRSKNNIQAALLMCIMGYSGVTRSATATSTFSVTATVISDCIINSATTLAFPSYDPTSGTDTTGSSTLSITCTSGTGFNLGLNAGTGSGATVATRKMTRTAGGVQTLNYSLYSDPSNTVLWGNTIGTDTVASTATGLAQNFTVYGKIPASQTVPAASYLDTITLTVTY